MLPLCYFSKIRHTVKYLVVVPKLGLGQEGTEFHCLLWGTLEVACKEGFLDMQEKDMPAKQCENEVMPGH